MSEMPLAQRLLKRIPTWKLKWLLLVVPWFSPSAGWAQQSGSPDLGSIAGNLTGSFANLAKLITAASYMAGMGFAMASLLKFKAHKDNPTQIPIGTPIALLFIAAGLIFLPNIFIIAGNTIFGGTSGAGGVTGTTGL